MMFQAFATLALVFIVVYAYSQARVAPHLTKFTVLVAVCGEYLILFPNQTTRIASFFGVGRGADLVFYFWILLSVAVLLNVHLRLRTLNDKLIQLTRQLALRDAASESAPQLATTQRS